MSTENKEKGARKIDLLFVVAFIALAVFVGTLLFVKNQQGKKTANTNQQLPSTLQQAQSISGKIGSIDPSAKKMAFEADVKDSQNAGKFVKKTFTVEFDSATVMQKRNTALLPANDAYSPLALTDLTVGQTIIISTKDNPLAKDVLHALTMNYYY